MNKLSKKDVLKVANLARLTLTENEIERFSYELNKILDYVSKLSEISTDGIEPTSHPNITDTPFRKDEPVDSFSVESALDNSPDKKDDFFRVPRVIK